MSIKTNAPILKYNGFIIETFAESSAKFKINLAKVRAVKEAAEIVINCKVKVHKESLPIINDYIKYCREGFSPEGEFTTTLKYVDSPRIETYDEEIRRAQNQLELETDSSKKLSISNFIDSKVEKINKISKLSLEIFEKAQQAQEAIDRPVEGVCVIQ